MNQIKYSNNPITDIRTTGLHWIEASAGTGKTFTLTAVIVRLLLEKYLPKQIIATTFTRKAAAELKARVRSRLREVAQYVNKCRSWTSIELEQEIQQQNDPLFKVILVEYGDRIGHICERVNLVSQQYDELFIGTLDSFTQKLLREFTFESGVTEQRPLTENRKVYVEQIVHDSLRAWIEEQPQALIDILYRENILQPIENYLAVLDTAENFRSATWEKIAEPDAKALLQASELLQSEVFIERVLALDLSVCEHDQFETLNKVKTGNPLIKLLEEQTKLKASRLGLSKKQQESIIKACKTLVENGVQFKKGQSSTALQHLILALVGECQQLCDEQDKIKAMLLHYKTFLNYYVIQQVQQKLPQVLQQHKESTFSEQTHHLAQALLGEKGEAFARVVHHRYPVILVDEFQDTNQEQDVILQRIWRDESRCKTGCMVMVGDDKQAIYSFRGGDMLTYMNARKQVQAIATQGHAYFYTLEQNHRSVAPLVEAVDALFQRATDFGEAVIYKPIRAGSRPHPALIDESQSNPFPLRWIDLSVSSNESSSLGLQDVQVVCQIQHLLDKAQRGQLYFIDNQQKIPLTVNDIAVLSARNNDLLLVQKQLNRYRIPSYIKSRSSVFDSGIARDVGHLLSCILNPYREDSLKRVLLSTLFHFRVAEVIRLEQKNELSDYMRHFNEIRELWQQQGFSVAWKACFERFNIWSNVVKYPHQDNERYITNLRHLSDILMHKSEQYRGIHQLSSWYQKQIHQPQTRDWEIEHKLSNDHGISLMTIHASKGLEFKIVFLLSADNSLKSNHQDELIFSESNQQRVISLNHQGLTEQQNRQHQQRKESENHRLWYVALTRASHRVYMMLHRKKEAGGVAYWLQSENQREFQHHHGMLQPIVCDIPQFQYQPEIESSQALQALALPTQKFVAMTRTSFTGLTLAKSPQRKANEDMEEAMLKSHHDHWQEQQYLHEQPMDTADVVLSATTPIGWIQQHFPKGIETGVFLHSLFEHLAFSELVESQFNEQKQQDVYTEIQRRFKNGYAILKRQLLDHLVEQHATDEQFSQLNESAQRIRLENDLYSLMTSWLCQVVKTSFIGQFSLSDLVADQYLNELEFNLAVQGGTLNVHHIEQLFKRYQYDLSLNHYHTARYLTGIIDLVFFDGERYHILDFKSNFLGENLEDYSHEALQTTMSKSQYWLQAMIYLVALHRYLETRLKHYQLQKHLGSAHYFYLRGMNGTPNQGVFSWRPDDEFILQFDALLNHHLE